MPKGKLVTLLITPLVLLGSCSATLRIEGTAPIQQTTSGCENPTLVDLPSAPMLVVVHWTGPASGRDSVVVNPGGAFQFVRSVPVGEYQVHAWAVDAEGDIGCDTTVTRVLGKPWKPRLD